MGMGTAPCSGWIISEENIAKIVPKEWAAFQETVMKANENLDFDFDSFAQGDDSQEGNAEVQAALTTLVSAFEQATITTQAVGLELSCFHYDRENGDRYDELEDGVNWSVEGMTQLTPSGEKFKDVIEQKGWTQYG